MKRELQIILFPKVAAEKIRKLIPNSEETEFGRDFMKSVESGGTRVSASNPIELNSRVHELCGFLRCGIQYTLSNSKE